MSNTNLWSHCRQMIWMTKNIKKLQKTIDICMKSYYNLMVRFHTFLKGEMTMNEKINQINKRYNYLLTETNSVYHDIFQKMGLSDSAAYVLYALCNSEGTCLLGEICSLSGIPKQTLNSALRKLETEGMICLEAAGGKKKYVYLTEKGRALSENTIRKVIDMENDILAEWTDEERRLYIVLAEKYLDGLKEKMKRL